MFDKSRLHDIKPHNHIFINYQYNVEAVLKKSALNSTDTETFVFIYLGET